MADTCTLQIKVFGGARTLVDPPIEIFFRVIGTRGPVIERYVTTSTLTIDNLPFHDNADDNYLVIIVADDYQQVGFQPVKVSASAPTIVELMVIGYRVSAVRLAFGAQGKPWAMVSGATA